ncbi:MULTISPECIES: hypothetical protein [Achromobacter]|uniref:hypothetical protein n=1 Tax=Achromobacter TaxID=222 RepID=UPI0023F8FA26|nr:hypothetical protein [Achromobacter anxifer]MDF8365094.1 hypothetical protein [Achromobacter anxifer]
MHDGAVTIDEFDAETRAAVDAFFADWRAQHASNPDRYPLSFPKDNAGLWTEMLVDWLTHFEPAKSEQSEGSTNDR